MNRGILTLEEFRKQELRFLPNATGELSNLLKDVALAAKRVNVEVNKAGLVDIFGKTGHLNVHGEAVQRLDQIAHEEFMLAFQRGISCAGMVSEECEDFISFDEALCKESKYIVVIDPLDGSSNIDVNVTIGTIFGVYRRTTARGSSCNLDDFLQKGESLVAAGYIIYGPSTMLVYATRRGVNGFTLDPGIGEFILSHPDIRCPTHGKYYSFNHSNYSGYNKKVKDFIDNCQNSVNENGDGDGFSQRYTGSLVADMHRNLLKGGIYLYPETNKQQFGKLRLLYECNPFAFILEVAGGQATDGKKRILLLQPLFLHEKSVFYAGSNTLMSQFISKNLTA